jgi:hypothetical protein
MSIENTRTGAELMLPELARQVVAEIAPDELEQLPEATDAWLAGDVRLPGDRRWLGGSIRFGLDPELVSAVILPVLASAISEVVNKSGERFWQRLLRRFRRRRPDPTVPALTAAQADAVRTSCIANAVAAGVAAKRAALIGDAVYGSLLRAANPIPQSSEAAE